jgi:hypothetical protein
MDAREQFKQNGFDVEVEVETPDLFWCHLISVGGYGRVPNYGSGSTEQEAVKRAWQRYEEEQ